MEDLMTTMTTSACTLPTVERPLRLAEFDELFRGSVTAVKPGAITARLTLAGSSGLLDRVQDLTARESACCSFFTFTITGDDRGVVLEINVPRERATILHALAARAVELSA